MRRHPILFGILLLLGVGVLFFLVITYLTRDGADFSRKDKIGVVVVKGFIGDSKNIVDKLDEYDRDEGVKAVVLRLETPGGAIVPSQEIYEKVLKVKRKKKVIASMGTVAASGGYYIACAADRIVANPGTITGSIGVIAQFSQIEELLKKIGLKSTIIKSGKYKDVGSPVREMTKDEKKIIQALIDDIYEQFVEVVAENRKIPKEKIINTAGAKAFTGRQALEFGLVDELGTMEYSVELAAKMAGIEGEPEVIYPEEKGRGLLKYILGEAASALSEELGYLHGGIEYLYPGGLMERM
ncbi:MAG: signal peptide peptidase SppA [Syntrophobacterales bacterium]|nr:MAG: signal peptide peptidase SppA [Syntrophobacterales bacterium]